MAKRAKCKWCGLKSLTKVQYRHCSECGRELHGSSKKCPKCGGKSVTETYYYCRACGKQP